MFNCKTKRIKVQLTVRSLWNPSFTTFLVAYENIVLDPCNICLLSSGWVMLVWKMVCFYFHGVVTAPSQTPVHPTLCPVFLQLCLHASSVKLER